MRGSLPIGTVVKGYQIEQVLSAAGNFSAVYIAYDTDAARVSRRRDLVAGRLGRWRDRYGPSAALTPIDPGPRVALKEYAPRDFSVRRGTDVIAAPEKARVFEWGRNRFKRESVFLSEHSHPNIVAVFDYFAAFSTEYYVMEHLTGGSLGEMVEREGIQTEAQVRRWLEPVLEGLASVERRDADHLDISPGNIMFRRVGGDAVLVDFGAARIPGSSPLHSTTRLIVDDHFAAPEKFTRGSRELDTRCDVYSLGAVINFALTGEQPPSGNNRSAGSADMSTGAARRRAERASPAFLRTVDRAFSVSPVDRHASAAAFSEALQNERGSVVAFALPKTNDKTLPLLLLGGAVCFLVMFVAILLYIFVP